MAISTPACLAPGSSLRWLMRCRPRRPGCSGPLVSGSFGEQRRPPRGFDQQPLEATATISACLAAWRADGDAGVGSDADRAFAWFLGRTISPCRWSIRHTGSCRDGLHSDRANENRGGESVVSYLLGLAEMRQPGPCRVEKSAAGPRRAALHA